MSDSLTPAERLAVELSLEGHDDESSAVLLLDAVFSRICAANPDHLTKCAQDLQDQMVEVLEAWLPPTLQVVDRVIP